MAQMLFPRDLIPAFESTLRRATLSGMRVHTATGRTETGTARFSHESILRYLDIAALLTAARVEAEAVRPLFNNRVPSGGSFDLSNMLRLRGTTPNVNGAVARRRTRTSDAYYSDRSASPTDEDPAYIFEGGQLVVRGDTENPSGSSIGVVRSPLTTKNAELGVSLSGSTLSTGTPDTKHEETILYLDDQSTVYSGRILQTGSSTEVDTNAPDASYDVTFFDHACSKLSSRHKAAVVEFAATLAFASIGDGDALEASASNFAGEISSDVMPAFDLRDTSE